MAESLREPTFLILTALAAEPRHGYGIIQEVDVLSDGRVSLRPGTLYGALDRLADEGLIEPDREEIVDGRLRRYYRITEPGTGLLTAEAERMRRIADAAQQRIAAGRRTQRGRGRAAARPASPATARPASPATVRPASPAAGRAGRGLQPGPAGGTA